MGIFGWGSTSKSTTEESEENKENRERIASYFLANKDIDTHLENVVSTGSDRFGVLKIAAQNAALFNDVRVKQARVENAGIEQSALEGREDFKHLFKHYVNTQKKLEKFKKMKGLSQQAGSLNTLAGKLSPTADKKRFQSQKAMMGIVYLIAEILLYYEHTVLSEGYGENHAYTYKSKGEIPQDYILKQLSNTNTKTKDTYSPLFKKLFNKAETIEKLLADNENSPYIPASKTPRFLQEIRDLRRKGVYADTLKRIGKRARLGRNFTKKPAARVQQLPRNVESTHANLEELQRMLDTILETQKKIKKVL
jgi:hypothetical protein